MQNHRERNFSSELSDLIWGSALATLQNVQTLSSHSGPKQKVSYQLVYACYLLGITPREALRNVKFVTQNHVMTEELNWALKFIGMWKADNKKLLHYYKQIEDKQNEKIKFLANEKEKVQKINEIDQVLAQLNQSLLEFKSTFCAPNDVCPLYDALQKRQECVLKAFQTIYSAMCAGLKRSPNELLQKVTQFKPLTREGLSHLLKKQNDKGLAHKAFDLAIDHYLNVSLANLTLIDEMDKKIFTCSGSFTRTNVIAGLTIFRSKTRATYQLSRDVVYERALSDDYKKTRLGRMTRFVWDSLSSEQQHALRNPKQKPTVKPIKTARPLISSLGVNVYSIPLKLNTPPATVKGESVRNRRHRPNKTPSRVLRRIQ